MRVYLDTEFTQFTYPNLISIGLVADNGREFYAVLKSFPLQKCSVFVREVVLPIIEHWPSTTLDRSELRQSLKQWLNEAAEPLEIVCDFATDAELLIELIDGYTAHVLVLPISLKSHPWIWTCHKPRQDTSTGFLFV